MFDEILRKVRFEVELLILVAIFSLSLPSFLIADAIIALGTEQYGLGLTVIKLSELIFAFIWFFLSLKIIVEINRLRKRHFKIFFLRTLEGMDEEQKKSEASELVRVIVAFYRGYYTNVSALLTLSIAVSSLIVVVVAYLLLNGYMTFWVAVFRWMLGSLMLLIASAIYVYVHRSWGRKLLKVKDAERKLSDMLGGPIEA